MGDVIRPVRIVNATPVKEVLGLGDTSDEKFIAIIWTDENDVTVCFPIPRAEAVRLTRMLLHQLGPQEPFPDRTATEHVVRHLRKK